MANSPTKVDLDLTYAQQTAVVVSDGDFADVLTTLKTDEPDNLATATAIPVAAGQLWSNFVDDFIRATWDNLQGLKKIEVDTTNATPDVSTVLATLSADGDSIYISLRIQAKTASDGEVVSGKLAGLFYRTAGSVLVMDPVKTLADVGLAGVDIDLDISVDDIRLELTGIAATNIHWTAYIDDLKPVVGP